MESKNLAIMFTDMKGFTSKTSQQTRAENEAMLQRHCELLSPVIATHKGTIVKSIGDSFLIIFESCTNAVLAGVEIQKALGQWNAQQEESQRIEVRIAIAAGDVRVEQNDVFGEAVNIASRLEGITGASEIYFTDSVFFSMNRQEVPFSEIGEKELRDIPYKVRVFQATIRGPGQASVPAARSEAEGDARFLGELESEQPESASIGDVLQECLRAFLPQVAGKEVKVMVVPPRGIVPLVRVKPVALGKAVIALLRYTLASMSSRAGRLQIEFAASAFRFADVEATRELIRNLAGRHACVAKDVVSAIRGNAAAKLEITFSDETRYQNNTDFLLHWQNKFNEKSEDLNLDFCAVYKTVQCCGGTILFDRPPGRMSTFKLKFPIAR